MLSLNPRPSLYLVFFAVILALLWMILIGLLPSPDPRLAVNTDFAAYWCTTKLFLSGVNPYGPITADLVDPVCGQLGMQRIYNLPWALVLLSPLACLPVEIAATVNAVLSASALFMAVFVAWRAFHTSPVPFLSILPAVIYAPTVIAFSVGHFCPFVMLGVSLVTYFVRCNRPILAGFSMTLLLLKPHTAYLYVAWLLAHALFRKQWAMPLSIAFSVAFLALCAEYIHPNIFSQWLSQTHMPFNYSTPTIAFFAASLPSKQLYYGVLAGCALGALITVIVLAWRSRHRSEPLSVTGTAGLLCSSLFLSPYNWTFDQMNLIVVTVASIAQTRNRALAFCAWTALGMLTLVHYSKISSYAELFWIPIATFALAATLERISSIQAH